MNPETTLATFCWTTRRVPAPLGRGSRLAAAFTALAAPAAAMVLNASIATAAVSDLDIHLGHSNGYGASCSYTVTATSTGNQQVMFSDDAGATFTPAALITPTGGAATVNWIPSALGTHTISASQEGSVKSMVVNVGSGINTGSSNCLVLV